MKKTWYKIGIFSMMLLYNLSVILFSLSFKRITDLLTNRDYNFFYYEIIYIIGIVLTQVISSNTGHFLAVAGHLYYNYTQAQQYNGKVR